MKCVVTGATGFIGSELCRQLQARQVEVVSSGREPASAEAMATAHSLFCCAGVAHQSASPEQHEEANYRLVLQQANAAHEAGVRQFVFLSSVKADAKGNSSGYWKWRAEQELQQSFAKAAMNVVIVRPALVYGPGVKGNLRSLMKAAALGLPMPPPSQPRSLIGVGDLCGALCCLLDKDLRGVQVVIATHTGNGRVMRTWRFIEDGYIVADNLSPKKARILLMLALTKTGDSEEIQRMMLTY